MRLLTVKWYENWLKGSRELSIVSIGNGTYAYATGRCVSRFPCQPARTHLYS